MIEMGKKYQTRDGRSVRILATDMKCGDASIIGLVMGANGTEFPACWRTSGRTLEIGVTTSEGDLVPVPTKHEGFIVVGKDGFVWGQNVVSTIGEAIESGFQKEEGDHIVRITWED
jgi:hypothetical protein